MKLSQARLLYSLIAHNQNLQDKRHPMFEKNKAMKIFGYFFIAFWAVYLMAIGIVLHLGFDGGALESFDMLNGGLMFFLSFDFVVRTAFQETPAQDVKPYKLLPIPLRFLLHVFLLRMGLRLYNFFWFFLLMPFGFLAIPRFYGFIGLVGFLVGWWCLFVANSYWYLLWRTFVNRNILLFAIPLALYAALIYFGIFFDEHNQFLFDASVRLMRGFITGQPWSYLVFIAVVVPLYFANFHFQSKSIYREIAHADQTPTVKSNNMTFLDRFGQLGEYLKLEIKSTIRNAVVRKQFLTGFFFMLMLSALFAFTEVYDGMPFMRTFICVYCFSCLGVMTLTTIMCAEGNYIDGLMSRKESVLSLLRAKYYFNCCVLIVPLLFSVMPVAKGKLTLADVLACMFFTSGVIFPCLFQLAAYNSNAINLNAKVTKAGRDTKTQMIVSSAALFLPMVVMYSLTCVFSSNIAAGIMIAVGAAGTILHPLWMRGIYRRFMKRRHVIMAGFRDSRED